MKIAYLFAFLPALALATTPKPDPTPVGISQEQAATADADARAAAGAISGSRSDATGGTANAAGGAGGAGGAGTGTATAAGGNATGNGSVDVEGDTSRFDAKALALGHIRAAPAPAVPGECRWHTAGWDITVFSKTGATRFDRECLAEQRCFRMAEFYERLGRPQAAMAMLSTCGGLMTVPVEAAPTPRVDLSEYVTRKELIEREKRQFEKSVAK
jgi:hypothetical protein